MIAIKEDTPNARYTVFKFDLTLETHQNIKIPRDHQILSIQTQRGKPRMWVRVNPESEPTTVALHTVCTGCPFAFDVSKFLGTYQVQSGDLVFHVFQI